MISVHGRIEFRTLSLGAITGDETFRIEALPEGGRRLEVICQMLDRDMERRVELEVDPSFAPLRAAVWSRAGTEPPQHARYTFSADQVIVETLEVDDSDPNDLSREDDWEREVLPLTHRIDAFAPHSLISDGWQTGSHPGKGGPEAHSYLMLSSSPLEDGGGGLEPVLIPRSMEFEGLVQLESPIAGETEALKYRILCSRPDWEPIEVWVRAQDRLLLRAAWPVLDGYYQLVEYEERTPSHPDGQGLKIVRG